MVESSHRNFFASFESGSMYADAESRTVTSLPYSTNLKKPQVGGYDLFSDDGQISKTKQRKQAFLEKKKSEKAEQKILKQTANAKTQAEIDELNQKLKQTKVQEPKVEEKNKIDPEKQLKKLNKLLRQIEDLERKIEEGEINPDKDQLAKVARKAEVLKEIEQLNS